MTSEEHPEEERKAPFVWPGSSGEDEEAAEAARAAGEDDESAVAEARRFLLGGGDKKEGETPPEGDATQDTQAPAAAQPPEATAEETSEEETDEEAEEPADRGGLNIPPDPDDGTKRRWYAIHAYSGQEGNVKKNIEIHAQQEDLQDKVGAVLVPMEEVAEIKSGEKKVSKRKFFPGYVLVRLPEHPERDPELWHMIKETPGVSGFIGSRTVPVPLDEAEVQAIIEELRGERERPKPKVKFEEGERVKIIDGPFSNFLGNIDGINAERGTLKVMVEIFERLTSVEVEFWQVEKV
jgi:transcription termination/antitermination protein NusG